MKVLTVTTLEIISPEIQRDIHYTLRMEHHTDYVFKDEAASQYSATISMPDTEEVILKIIECSTEVPGYTIVLNEVDMNANRIVRQQIQNGKVLDKKQGSWEWEG